MATPAVFGHSLAGALGEFLERETIRRELFPTRAWSASRDAGSQRFRASAARLLSRLGWEVARHFLPWSLPYAGDATVHLFVTPKRSLGPVVVFGAAPQQPEEEIGRVVQQAARLRAFLRACGQSPAMPVRSLVVTGTEPSPAPLLAAAIVARHFCPGRSRWSLGVRASIPGRVRPLALRAPPSCRQSKCG